MDLMISRSGNNQGRTCVFSLRGWHLRDLLEEVAAVLEVEELSSVRICGAHTKRKFKYGKELCLLVGSVCECTS